MNVKKMLIDLNEIKLFEANLSFIIKNYSDQIEKYFEIKNRQQIEDLIIEFLVESDYNDKIRKSLPTLSNKKLFEIYILLGLNFLDYLKDDFYKNYF